jgi:uncharacterized protein
MAASDTFSEGDKHLERLAAFLSNPKTHGVHASAISDAIETHGAMIFLVGDRAYKIKKPVALPYMDLSTVARRRRICRREVEINRRTAPDIYLGVGEVVVGRDGHWRLLGPDTDRADGERLVESVVVMRRFDDGLLFDRLAERGALTDHDLDALAVTIAEAHSEAPKRRQRSGASRVADVLEINTSGLEAGVPEVFEAAPVRDLVERTEAVAAHLRSPLDARARRGAVRRCHGDLHLRNVFRGDDGQPVLFDALEFDEDLATIGVAYDLAFILMDLRHRGLTTEANRVWNGWVSATGDDGAAAVLPLFLSMRAAVRAHVGATAAVQRKLDSAKSDEARRYLEQARQALNPVVPAVVAIGGISGTGKTTLARAVAHLLGPPPGAVVLRSDVVRKRQLGVAETERLPKAAYEPAVSSKVFAEIHRRARRLAEFGSAVIADAVYGRCEDRRAIARAAGRAGTRFLGVWLELPKEEAQSRVAKRRGDASDATVDVVAKQATSIVSPRNWLVLDATRPVAELAAEVVEAVRNH